ncbi:MAG: hypothetical protein IIY16_02335, partial [Oscillospiraceae bacterium]|nr:hypothetical protein [Oscillospiraceae bacterium]
MIEFLIYLGKMLLMTLPFVLFALLNSKANLKKEERSRQFLMPIVAVIYGIVVLILLSQISGWLIALLNKIPVWIAKLADAVEGMLDGKLASVAAVIDSLAALVKNILTQVNLKFWICFVANAAIMLVFITLKKIFLAIFRRACKPGTTMHDTLGGIFYETDDEIKKWYVKHHFGQGRTFLKTLYIASIVISVIALLISGQMYKKEMLAVPFYPVFGIMILGEVYFFLCGLTRNEMKGEITGEEDEAATVSNYSLLRKMLRKLFGDKLTAEDTAATNAASDTQTIEELLDELEHGPSGAEEAYGHYMRLRSEAGFELERNYLMSGLDLLRGKSILFNNPFYYDLIPYAFYPLNRTLLRHKKVLIVLGRHGMEEDIAVWCEEGLRAITNVPGLWNIGVLGEDEAKDLDIGIVTRSSVHDLKLHEANEEFFERVEFVILIEPSRLITTAQIGLNSLVRHCRRGSKNKQITFCSTDKNCDGLVDALSHILMSSISEVAATNRHQGVCSYMCWETDREHLQHRMLPNLSRYLGVGTELSFAALKNQVKETDWYGGEAFPVVDMHWIVKQYYYDLLHYAGLPISQKTIEEHFKVSPNLWNADVRENRYLTVEDEACNMFEVKRTFSTRATNQSFINVISPEYLLKDYMAENDSIFNADPKAIPYIVADYARTARNVVMRLCLRMSTGMVPESELCRELMLIDADTEHPWESFWHQVCVVNSPVGVLMHNKEGYEVLVRQVGSREVVFAPDTICRKRKFSMKTGQMETLYFIQDNNFKRALLSELQNAGYIAEDENGERRYLGTELRGQIFQKYLPGQFFTFGGKYYEMLTVTSDGRVLVRRAADHITGRPSYRQERHYAIHAAVDSTAMGDSRQVGFLKLTRQYADISVKTPAYWQLDRHNDFASGRKVTINGIPDRSYYNK